MILNILGRALGACLSEADNLRAVYLPEGVPTPLAESIVREANRLRPGAIPFAVLVHPGASSDDGCIRVWPPENVIKYRQGDRLIVGLGRHTDFHSISTSFAEVFGLSYPLDDSGLVALERVASKALDLIVEDFGSQSEVHFDRERAAARLGDCLMQLRDIHLEMRRGDLVWNAQWFAHANTGLDRLCRFLTSKATTAPSSLLDDLFKRYTYAAFSLPAPGAPKPSGKAIAAASDDWWSDATTVKTTVKLLKHHPDTESAEHPLADLEWSDFDFDVVNAGNPIVALLCPNQPENDVIEAFGALTAGQFLDPTNHLAEEREIVVVGMNGEDCTASDVPNVGPFLLESSLVSDDMTESEPVRVLIPTLAAPTEDEVAESSLTLSVSPSIYEWNGSLERDDSGSLWAVGSFNRRIKGTTPKPILPSTVSIQLATDDSLSHLVPVSASCTVVLIPPTPAGLLIMRIGAKKSLRKASYVGVESLVEGLSVDAMGAEETFPFTFDDAASSYRVIAWSSNQEAALHNGKVMGPLREKSGLFAATIKPTQLDVIEIGNQKFELRSPSPKSSIQSPIVAAIARQQVSGEKPSASTGSSIRGQLEDAYARHLTDADWMETLGHIAILSEREDIPLADFEREDSTQAMLMNPETRRAWGYLTDEEVPLELLQSSEAESFARAFAALGIPEAMRREGADSTDILEWASRTSWRHLWLSRKEELGDYLLSYAALVSKAREVGSPIGVFWAAYPFSASIWTSESSLECAAVMLSPLHPLRLAWLASVEGTLWESDGASGLAGTVEGWNFPLLGPRHSKAGRMVAIPMDSGEGQVFLGWSMLVGASVDGEKPLVAPHRIGRVAAPGSAASGLNATAATSALRSYRRMHPHISTLTIDLAASTTTSRLEEVDQAVLAQLQAWALEKSGTFRGGARVLDSLSRDGAVPSAAVADLARKNLGMPLLWSRYKPNLQKSQACNIRLLQDSGVHIEVGDSHQLNRGVVSSVPLRRFEAGAAPGANAKIAHSRPAIEPGRGGWEPYVTALTATEGAANGPQLSSKLYKSALVDNRADWTVSGESLLSPAAMATLVQSGGGGNQMLWEWRPPFLEPEDDVPTLERRPYVSVARVPSGFRKRLGQVLSKATGTEASDEAVGNLLGKLGARGVGLSSLLAMGGTQAAGALGFFLAFALAEHADGDDDAEHLVLPIDACDTFLKALAGTQEHAEKTQRADMLMLRLTSDALTLVPIEIKFYGLDSTGDAGHLPGLSDGALKEALTQLKSTMALLERLEGRGAELRREGRDHDRALWNNALTTLVEAGIRLKPAGSVVSDSLPARLQGVADGGIPVKVGRPLVTYFKHDALTLEGESFAMHRDVEYPDLGGLRYGMLIANGQAAFESLSAPDGALVSAWRDLVGWALSPAGDGTPHPTVDSAQSPEPKIAAPVGVEDAVEQTEETGFSPAGSILGDGVRFPVGRLTGVVGDAVAEFWPSNTALNQMNIGVVGDLGTGKTQLLKALILQLRTSAKTTQASPVSMLVFDYKRDFQDEGFLDAVGGKVLRSQGIPLNIFALDQGYSPLAAYQKASGFCDIVSRIYTGVGPVQRDRLITVITDLYKELSGEAPTLAEVRERYIADGRPDSVTGILNTFVLGEVFSSSRPDLVSFKDLINDQVLVLALNDLGADQNAKNSLVALFLNFYYDYMRNSPKWPFEGTNPQLRRLNSFLLVDEAVNIMGYAFDVLMDLMLQGREFGFGTILSSQFLSHFKSAAGPNYGEPLLTWFIHKVPNVSTKQLSQLGIPGADDEAARRIASLEVHHAYYSSLGFPGRFIAGTPFYQLLRRVPDSPSSET